MPNANTQLFELNLTVDRDGNVRYEPRPPYVVTERLALFVMNLKLGSGVEDVAFATAPVLWLTGASRRPGPIPAAVQVTRESDRVATILDTNVSLSEMHFFPVLWLMTESGQGGRWRYVIPTDPTIINRVDP